MNHQRPLIRRHGVPAYFLGRPSAVYLDRYRRRVDDGGQPMEVIPPIEALATA